MYMPLVKGTRDKENKETDTTAIMLYSLKKDQKTKAQLKKKLWDNTHPLSSHPHHPMNQPSPIIHNNKTMDTEFLV